MAIIADEDPLLATMYGLRDTDRVLADLTEEGESRLRARATAVAIRARELDDEALTSVDRVTRAVVQEQAEAVVHRIDSRAVEYTVTNHFVSPAAHVLHYLPRVPIADGDQADAYLSRLSQFSGYLATAASRHVGGAVAGRLPVTRLVRGAIVQLDRTVALGADDPLLDPIRHEGMERYADQGLRMLETEIRPALAKYRTALTELTPSARDDDQPGLCWITGGESIYASLIRVHTDSSHSPDVLHRTGERLVADLRAEIAQCGARLFGSSDVAGIFHRLRADETLRWRDGQEILDAARTAIQKAESQAPNWFSVVPEQRCVVEAVAPAQEAAIPSATYLMPSPDGKRPGTYSTNISRPTERYRHFAETMAFHEAVPGHHLQVTRAQGLRDLPMLRRLPLSTAYVEGWGLYAERLADEMGLYSDELSRIGMLVLDAMRAVRLVVDTGLHSGGWSRARAVEYMTANTAMPEVEIEAEVDRYIALPGQALAYMVGRMEITRIRTAAQDTLGDKFDIRTFHDTLLSGGTLPMPVLADVVADWTKST
ncbi:hypothetical protein AOZ06_37850 [Kibdelosporangium phytohabitans]|uniref:DUF885 domain-containing protein n=2 Tax=Kibdelosporangium phytohabitans TaxID=860235 RepID=A0A0N9I5K3_9PSEU|nr:DUF885 domain-containing protein [Kibdelosporangium phytohabitans]ALG15365.1 hypothetical protein AOZ06_37850 [Kibdelosporangium phytohabitans]